VPYACAPFIFIPQSGSELHRPITEILNYPISFLVISTD